jgi:DNA primase
MDQALIDQIRRSVDIVDVIGSYIAVKKAGTSFRAICPFHNDSHPSLNISQPKQIYKCFACGKAGNAFTFVQDFEKINFIEAAKKLASRSGIIIPEFDRPRVANTKRDLLLQIYRLAKDFYTSNLFEYGSQVLDYLKARQISPETAKSLELGYALNSNSGLKSYLLKQGIGVDIMKDCGLFGNYQGNLNDQFKERLMFPVHSNTGDVIAFSGRILSDNQEGGKYINSPGTELYTKGKELYGLFKTKYDISKADQALVCEGNFDFLRLYECGITNSCASLGTALTEDQIYLLGRYTKNIYMLYDGDVAGQKAALRSALLILSKGFIPRIVQLPESEDPDTYLIRYGKDELLKLVKNAFTLVNFMAHNERIDIPVKDRVDLLTDAIRQVKDAIQREFLLKDVAEAFGVSEGAVKQKISQASRPAQEQSQPESDAEAQIEERQLLILALKDRNCYNSLAHELTSDYFFNQEYKQIYRYLTAQDRSADLDEPARLLDQMENPALREQLADLLFEDLPGMSFEDALLQVTIRHIQHDIDLLDRKMKAEPSNLELFKQKAVLIQQLKSLSTNTVVYRIIV